MTRVSPTPRNMLLAAALLSAIPVQAASQLPELSAGGLFGSPVRWTGAFETELFGGNFGGNGGSIIRGVPASTELEFRGGAGTLFQWKPGTLFSWKRSIDSRGVPGLGDPLVTDRPDFTEASSTVGLGIVQLETGYTFTVDDDGMASTTSHSYFEPLLRYGVLQNWLELRVGWNYTREETGGTTVAGDEDLYLGFKIGLTPQDGVFPEMALIPQMTVPTGTVSQRAVMPGVNWVYSWDIGGSVTIAGSTQFNRARDGATGNTFTEWAQSATVGYSLTDRLGAYTEWYVFLPDDAGSARTEHYINGGFTVLLNHDVQWDVRVGTGLNRAADDFFAGTGLAIRFR